MYHFSGTICKTYPADNLAFCMHLSSILHNQVNPHHFLTDTNSDLHQKLLFVIRPKVNNFNITDIFLWVYNINKSSFSKKIVNKNNALVIYDKRSFDIINCHWLTKQISKCSHFRMSKFCLISYLLTKTVFMMISVTNWRLNVVNFLSQGIWPTCPSPRPPPPLIPKTDLEANFHGSCHWKRSPNYRKLHITN